MDVKDLTLAHVKSHLQVNITKPLSLSLSLFFCVFVCVAHSSGAVLVHPTGTIADESSELKTSELCFSL